MLRRSRKVVCGALFTVLLGSVPAAADIYKYEDSEGVIHFFTDAPAEDRPAARTGGKGRKVRTTFGLSGHARAPKEFEPIIDWYAEEYGVDKALVKAVIHVESGYNPNAVSPKGAAGLMQLMPRTAQGLKVANSFDPAENIRGGVRHLRFLLDTFRGNVHLALAAYNAGLATVTRYGGIPPYEETRTYVARVMDYRRSYVTD